MDGIEDGLLQEAANYIARQHAAFIDKQVFSFLDKKFPDGWDIKDLKERGKFVIRPIHVGMPEHQFHFDGKPVLQFFQGFKDGEWKVWCDEL